MVVSVLRCYLYLLCCSDSASGPTWKRTCCRQLWNAWSRWYCNSWLVVLQCIRTHTQGKYEHSACSSLTGLFIALLCRFDSRWVPYRDHLCWSCYLPLVYNSNHPSGKRVYFMLSFAAYIIGLATTITVMHVFNAAQPALLYLVPCCVGLPLLQALIRKEVIPLFKYINAMLLFYSWRLLYIYLFNRYSDYPEKRKEAKETESSAISNSSN